MDSLSSTNKSDNNGAPRTAWCCDFDAQVGMHSELAAELKAHPDTVRYMARRCVWFGPTPKQALSPEAY